MNLEDLKVQDLMTERVFSVHPNDTLDKVYEMMNEENVRHVPVINMEQELEGIVSQRDLTHAILHGDTELPYAELQELLKSTKVHEIMTTDAESIDPLEKATEAGMIMLENKFGCLPVVSGTRLVGILTESDFIRYFVRHQKQKTQKTKKQ